MKIRLMRIASRADGTFGVLFADDLPFALTIERPWRFNKQSESCIPVGSYVCKPYSSARFPHTWQVMDVPGRSAILFHQGNVMEDSLGCILVGEQFDVLGNRCAVTASAQGFKEFMQRTSGLEEFDLEIFQP